MRSTRDTASPYGMKVGAWQRKLTPLTRKLKMPERSMMKLWTVVPTMVATCAFALALTACSAGIAQVPTARTTVTRSGTPDRASLYGWMLAETSSAALLYASDSTDRVVRVYSYPSGQQVGLLKGFPAEPAGLCSDSSGDVYVTTLGDGSDSNLSYVYEYAHGGTEPIATLSDPGLAKGCAIDAVTGNLAVSNLPAPYGSVAVYQDARGEPTTYSDPSFGGFEFCTYDEGGNLFADGGPEDAIDMLPKGSTAFTEIQLSEDIDSGSIQWWHNRLVIAEIEAGARGDQPIFEVRISGDNGIVRGPTLLRSRHGSRPTGSVQFWIDGHTIIGPGHKAGGLNGILEFWKYPKGGLATKVIGSHHHAFTGVTVSTESSSRSRRAKTVR